MAKVEGTLAIEVLLQTGQAMSAFFSAFHKPFCLQTNLRKNGRRRIANRKQS